MKCEVDKDGYLKIDAQSLVQSLPDKVLRDIAKYSIFDELLLSGIVGALVDGNMWGDDDDPPWWFGGDTFTKLRLKLLPLLPEITAEAVRYLDAETKRARAHADRWRDVAFRLEREWPRGPSGPRASIEYSYRSEMTSEQATAYLRQVEEKIGATDRTELEQLRIDIEHLRKENRELRQECHDRRFDPNLVRENVELRAQLDAARVAARALASRIDDLGMAADDNDPKVMATAGPIGEAEADLFIALGIYEEEVAKRQKAGAQ